MLVTGKQRQSCLTDHGHGHGLFFTRASFPSLSSKRRCFGLGWARHSQRAYTCTRILLLPLCHGPLHHEISRGLSLDPSQSLISDLFLILMTCLVPLVTFPAASKTSDQRQFSCLVPDRALTLFFQSTPSQNVTRTDQGPEQ